MRRLATLGGAVAIWMVALAAPALATDPSARAYDETHGVREGVLSVLELVEEDPSVPPPAVAAPAADPAESRSSPPASNSHRQTTPQGASAAEEERAFARRVPAQVSSVPLDGHDVGVLLGATIALGLAGIALVGAGVAYSRSDSEPYA
jgi:hypothetical protein